MTKMLRLSTAGLALTFIAPTIGAAQTFEGLGTRAQGMGGAFVAVADDASAVFWNPAGLAAGAYFSLVLDRTSGESTSDDDARAARHSGWLLALTMPAVGLTYYRLHHAVAAPLAEATMPATRVESLVTHHAGATLVHSLADGIAVGATVKLVRGMAAAAAVSGRRAEDLVDSELEGPKTTRFDADVGVMAAGPLIRAGLTVRNLTEPEFESSDGSELALKRQARAGVALKLTPIWIAAADLDLTRNTGPLGDLRTLALGSEVRILRRAFARAGVNFNTADSDRAPGLSVGGTYAFGGFLVDAQVTGGSESALKGWGVGARIVF